MVLGKELFPPDYSYYRLQLGKTKIVGRGDNLYYIYNSLHIIVALLFLILQTVICK